MYRSPEFVPSAVSANNPPAIVCSVEIEARLTWSSIASKDAVNTRRKAAKPNSLFMLKGNRRANVGSRFYPDQDT